MPGLEMTPELRARAERAMLAIAMRRWPGAELTVVWREPNPVSDGAAHDGGGA